MYISLIGIFLFINSQNKYQISCDIVLIHVNTLYIIEREITQSQTKIYIKNKYLYFHYLLLHTTIAYNENHLQPGPFSENNSTEYSNKTETF